MRRNPALMLSFRQHLGDLVPDDAVTLAGHLLQFAAIQDLDPAATGADQAGTLQRAQREIDRGPLHAEHLREKLLRERDLVAVGSIPRVEQPSGEPPLDPVKRVACRGLLDLQQHRLVVADDRIPEPGAFRDCLLQPGRRPRPDMAPTAPSRPTVAISIACPSRMTANSDTIALCGK